MPDTINILWADDEIDLLKPHVKFLETKGMSVEGVTNGEDALDQARNHPFDIIFLDENMPGLSGLEVLEQLQQVQPQTPVVMITKSEAETVMEEAIGKRISDYLIKPVNPTQILTSVKRLVHGRELASQAATQAYQKDFTQIAMAFSDVQSVEEWASLYRKLIHYEFELERSEESSMRDILDDQKHEANVTFGKFVARHYLDWVQAKPGERPLMSPDLFPQRVLPLTQQGEQQSTFFFLIDGLRMDQWRAFLPRISEYYNITEDSHHLSILPTATGYARNAIFSGLFPGEIADRFPRYWVDDDESGSKNAYEEDLLRELVTRHRLDLRLSYHKLLRNEEGNSLNDNILNLLQNDLNVVVINFIDMIAHARAEMNLIKELTPDERALRSLSRSWLEHSTFLSMLRKLSEQNVRVVLTTDHGLVRVRKPIKIIGDRNTTSNLRYKQGRNLNYDTKARMIYPIEKPEEAKLPKASVSGTYAFSMEDYFFVYPNNFNHYVNQYTNTLQHGGISLEEMLVPYVVLDPR